MDLQARTHKSAKRYLVSISVCVLDNHSRKTSFGSSSALELGVADRSVGCYGLLGYYSTGLARA